jgi:hypothetical protein
MTFVDRLDDAWVRIRQHLELALVPVFVGLLAFENVRRMADPDGFTIGVTFRFPAPIVDLWTFVHVPARTTGGLYVSPEVQFLPVLLLVEGVLAAGYLGSVEAALRTGSYDFIESIRRYGVRILVFTALWQLGVLLGGFLAVITPIFFFVGIVLFLWLSYRLYATPFLIVIRDLSLGEALGRSWRYGRDGGDYFSFGLGYLATVAAISIPTTLFVTLTGLVGVLVGIVVGAVLGLTLTAATMTFVREFSIVGPREP